jgi:membrane-bound serine protease (ClpP class)
LRTIAGFLLVLAGMILCAQNGWAQLPFPLGQDAPSEQPKEKAKRAKKKHEKPKREANEDDEDARSDDDEYDRPPKHYDKPTVVELPEGPADALHGPVVLIPFNGIVNPGMAEYVTTSLARAEKEGAQAVLIEIDTPGGLVTSTEKIVQAMLASKVPVIVFVSPSGAHAASAGTFITLAGHVAAMAPATRLGAAHPVTGSGKDPEAEGGKHMGRKVENDLVAFVEGIAKERHRNVAWAIDAVKSSVSITADRALELGVIDLIAHDRADLLDKLEGRQMMIGARKVELQTKGVQILEYKPSVREWLVNLLATPGVAMILLVLGSIGVLAEIYHPGVIAPGVMGVLCIICSLIAMEQLPIDLGGALLVLGGLGLLVAEIYTSTYGVLALLGVIGLVVGLLLLIDTKNPSYLVDESFALHVGDVAPVAALLLGFFAYISLVVMRKRKGRPVTGSEALVGLTGQVLKTVGPEGGTVFVSGEYWRARASEPIPEKEEIEVLKVEGLELEVRRKSP